MGRPDPQSLPDHVVKQQNERYRGTEVGFREFESVAAERFKCFGLFGLLPKDFHRRADKEGEAPTEPSAIMARVEQIMQPSQSELFLTEVPVIVEGLGDMAFISTYMQQSGKWERFRRLGCHFVLANGKMSLSRPLAISIGFGIPAFTIFDADGNQTNANERKNHVRDN